MNIPIFAIFKEYNIRGIDLILKGNANKLIDTCITQYQFELTHSILDFDFQEFSLELIYITIFC